MEALVIWIALLSYILSYIVLGLGFKYIEKHPASKGNGVNIFLNSKSSLYKTHHRNFKYFYENSEGLIYKTKIYNLKLVVYKL